MNNTFRRAQWIVVWAGLVFAAATSATGQDRRMESPPDPVVRPLRARHLQPARQAGEKVGLAVGELIGVAFREAAENQENGQQRAQIKQFEQQYERQFRQLLDTELLFIRDVCRPTPDEFRALRAVGAGIMDKVVADYAMAQFKQPRGSMGSLPSDPRPLMTRGLVAAATKIFSAERVSLYARELDQRNESRKRVAVMSIVAKLDRHLILTGDQREQFLDVLTVDWRESWSTLQVLTPGNRHFPNLPVSKLLPILTATQKAAWHSTYKKGPGYSGLNFGMVQGLEIDLDQ